MEGGHTILSEMARLMFRRCRSSAQNMIHAHNMMRRSIWATHQLTIAGPATSQGEALTFRTSFFSSSAVQEKLGS